MKNKVFTLSLLLLIAGAGAWAQNLPTAPITNYTASSIWTSPQSSTTEGRYRSNADDFIRPDSYTNVKFNKFFGFVSFLADGTYFSNGATGAAYATAGVATSIKDLYIAALYNGNFWTGAPAYNYTEMETTPTGGSKGNYDVYSSINASGSALNNAALLFGFADMGVRLTYRTNHQLFDKDGIVVGAQLYNNYHMENGVIAPQIAWAMTKNLLPNGIKPYVTLDLVFQRDNQVVETRGPDSSSNSGKRVDWSRNHFDPSFGFGLNGYTFFNQDGFRLSADLDYVLAFEFYDNEYRYVDGTQYKTGKIKGIFAQASNSFVEQSYVSNVITPSLSGQWSKDKLALKFKLNLPVSIYNTEQNLMALNASNALVYNGDSKKTDSFFFRPDLRLALQYKIVPDHLTLNVGARIQATAIALETITTTNYTMGAKNSTQKEHRDSYNHSGSPSPAGGNTTTSFASRFSLGPTFYFTENAWVEATTGVTNMYGDSAINVFSATGGLFSFGSILVALKF